MNLRPLETASREIDCFNSNIALCGYRRRRLDYEQADGTGQTRGCGREEEADNYCHVETYAIDVFVSFTPILNKRDSQR